MEQVVPEFEKPIRRGIVGLSQDDRKMLLE